MAEAKPKKPADKGSRSRSWFIVCPNVRTHGVAGAKPEDIATWTAQGKRQIRTCSEIFGVLL